MRSALILALAMAVLGCAAEATENASATQPAVQSAAQNQLVGTVLETLDAASYTYVRLDTPEGEEWAAVPQASLEIGAPVVIVKSQTMVDFESKTLERTFETIHFGTLEGAHGSAPMTQRGGNPHGESSGGMASANGADTGPIEVAKAEGPTGRTVAELYAEMGDFSGKTVALRGQVVKYSPGILGRNWIHLQDGTGDAASGTNDITVTSADTVAVGDIILVQGIVAVDKDFGAGYRYALIVEEASVN